MSSYTAPLSDIRFALHDVLKVEPLFARLGFADATADVVDAVLDEAGRFSTTVLAPLNSVGDEIGCVLDQASGEVTTPPGFKQAYAQFVDGGWTGLTAAPELGGRYFYDETVTQLNFARERVRLDEYYVRNWSVWMDLWILGRTLRCVITRRGAY